MFKRLLAFSLALALAPAAGAGEVRFTAKPRARRVRGKAEISFAVSSPTDVEVAVLDSKGKIVRHLAAGLFGANPPEPFRRGLRQSLTWDGKDDMGRPALSSSGGPFKVRVRLGLKPAFDRLIGFNPAALGSVRALAVGPEGEVFVFHVFGGLHPSDGTAVCSVFSRRGEYLRQIMPYPANLPEEKLRGLKRIELDGGVKVPFIYQAETRSLVPGAGDLPPHRAVVTSDARVAFVGVKEGPKRYAQAGVAQVVVIHADGSVPAGGVLGTVITKLSGWLAASLALSPDEKTVYASDVRHGRYAGGKPTHAVYRFGWADKKAAPFLGAPGEAGGDEKHFNDPKGVAVDRDGNVYVADKGNNRVAVFEPDGSFLGALKVEKPERVEVHPKTGAVYVLGGAEIDQLQKFASWKASAPAARAKLPHFRHERYTVVMALDASARPPVLWFGSHQGYYARFSLLRIEDRGNAFGEQVDVGKLALKGRPSVGAVTVLNLDRERELLYVGRGPRFDGRTGERQEMSVRIPKGSYRAGAFIALGLDGFIYLHSSGKNKGVYRFDREAKPAPFPGSGSNYIPNLGSLRLRGRGVSAGHDGKVYLLWQKPKDKLSPGDYGDSNALAVYGPDGKLIEEKLIDSEIRSLNSVRLDCAGNIYLALGLRPGEELLPPGLKGKVPEGRRDRNAVGGVNCYPLIYGCIAKFGPEGGVVRKGSGGVACNYGFGTPIEVKGAKWMFFGASNVPSWRTKGTPDICLCESPRFDVDGFGRSFFPDAGRFRVGVIDTAGNEICWFGSYGNQDSAGPGSAVPVPEIPLCWPHAVAAGDEAVYVADRLNRRVVRVKLNYAAEETCPVR